MKFLFKKQRITQSPKFVYKKKEKLGDPEEDERLAENEATDDTRENPLITDVVDEITTGTSLFVGSFSPHNQRHPATLGID